MAVLSRRGFLRVAILGAAGAATIAACPEFVEELVRRKSYFFLRSADPEIMALIQAKLAEAAAKMGEALATDVYLSGVGVPPGYPFGYMAKQYKASARISRKHQDDWLVDLNPSIPVGQTGWGDE